MSGASTAFGFVRERMGEEGSIEWSSQCGSVGTGECQSLALLLRLIRAISPSKAFEMVGKKSAYEMQHLTPYSVDELSRQKMVMNVPRCKILDYPRLKMSALWAANASTRNGWPSSST